MSKTGGVLGSDLFFAGEVYHCCVFLLSSLRFGVPCQSLELLVFLLLLLVNIDIAKFYGAPYACEVFLLCAPSDIVTHFFTFYY